MPQPSRRLASATLVFLLAGGLSACATAPDKRKVLRAAFHYQVSRCYSLPETAFEEAPTVLEVHLRPDGTLMRAPTVLQRSSDSATKAALLAVTTCTPFQLPPGAAELYEQWKVLHIQFTTERS